MTDEERSAQLKPLIADAIAAGVSRADIARNLRISEARVRQIANRMELKPKRYPTIESLPAGLGPRFALWLSRYGNVTRDPA